MAVIKESVYGVELQVGDKCFVLYHDREPRKGTIIHIYGELARIIFDDGTVADVRSDWLTLSFQLHDENRIRRAKAVPLPAPPPPSPIEKGGMPRAFDTQHKIWVWMLCGVMWGIVIGMTIRSWL